MSCDWPIDRSCLPPLPELGDTPTPEERSAYDHALLARNNAEDIAVQVLWSLSGRQFGACETTVRPCPTYAQGFGYGSVILTLDAGHWVSWPCGCIGGCSVSGPRVVHLPGPVDAIVSVTIEGAVLDPSGYQLEGNALYRTGGAWPRQDLGAPLGEPGTWSLTYTRGYPPPDGVDKLTGLLAKEFLAACAGGKCRLPRNVRSVARQGVNYEVYDPRDVYANGKTGLSEVDLWLAAVNPNHLMAAPEVL
ncbi:hypothetical protein [Mycobacterium sp. NPDC050853]|uniref:hypothetical protein n=1 Tax=Mycobacterium sp. NPDC050853 TaxID=3155160 RepID=UPI00340D9DBA